MGGHQETPFSAYSMTYSEVAELYACEFRAWQHVAQSLWSHMLDDDYAFVAAVPDLRNGSEVLRDELLRYFSWQRDHARLMATGLTSNEAHRQAECNRAMLRGKAA